MSEFQINLHLNRLRRPSAQPLDTSSAEAIQRWLTHRTFWFVAGVVAVVLLPFTLVWLFKQAWVIAAATGGGLVAVAWCAWQVRQNPQAHVERYTWSILVVEFLAMAANAWLQGGSDAPALRWQAIIPCIAIAAGAYKTGLTMTLFFVVQVMVMHHYQPDYIALFRPHVLPSPENQRVLAVIVPVCLFAFFGLFTTLWRRRVLDALELARQEARQGAEAKERFLATMSHEIRTPLNGVIGTLSLLRTGNLGAGQQRELVELATRSSHSLMSLLNDVLDWSKLEAKHIQIVEQPVSLRHVVQDTLDLFAVAAASKGIELRGEVASDVPAWVRSDESRLRQIMHNLLANAVKFTREGQVRMQLDADPLPQSEQVQLTLSVKDSGIGMSEEQMARLFKPFAQGDQSITRQYGGTGLGLAICQQLAELLGGRISVTSQVNQGSTFEFTWRAHLAESPASQGDDVSADMARRVHLRENVMAAVNPAHGALGSALPADEARESAASAGAGARVLIADDNPTNVLILSEMLVMQGLRCEQVATGPEALAACRRQRPDALFLDYQMPGMDGLTVIHHLRQEEASLGLPRLPVVLVSGDVPLRSVQAWREAGVDEVLSKPIDYAALQALVQDLRLT